MLSVPSIFAATFGFAARRENKARSSFILILLEFNLIILNTETVQTGASLSLSGRVARDRAIFVSLPDSAPFSADSFLEMNNGFL